MTVPKIVISMLACLALAPSAASAAVTGSVTGDDGNPLALAANGAAAGIRNMDVRALTHVDAADANSYRTAVTDPAGLDATTPGCRFGLDDTRFVDYHGNGTYKLTVTLYNDNNCATAPKATIVYSWTVGASVALGQPTTAFLTRAPGSFSTNTQSFDLAGNPGAVTYEIKYALGGTIAADGSVAGPAVKDAFRDSTTGKVQLIEHTPGSYVMVARAKSGAYTSPWSAPISIRLFAPFDLSSTSFPDSIGPSYQVRGIVGETTAGGRVTVSAARGKKGGAFRTLGRAKVNSKGVFALRFRLRKYGIYRLRYSYRGSATVAPGSVTQVVRIKRTRVSR
jgi:hypothetical protein